MEASVPAKEFVVVFGKLLHKVFQVTAVHTHMVDQKSQHVSLAIVEKSHSQLNVAVNGDVSGDEFVNVLFNVVGVLFNEEVTEGVVLNRPVGLNQISVESAVKHGHFLNRPNEHLLQGFHIKFAVIIMHAVHHSIIIVAEHILHFVPKFRFQCFVHITPLYMGFVRIKSLFCHFTKFLSHVGFCD